MVSNPPENTPRIAPYLLYEDAGAALEWLIRTFGLEERERMAGPDGTVQTFYRVDIDRLTAQQKDAVAEFITKRFCFSLDEVLADMANPDHGMPILADDVSVSFDARLVV